MYKTIIVTVLVSLTLIGCAGSRKDGGSAACRSALEVAYKELDFAASNGFSGTVNYTKAVSLLTAAKAQQTFEAYDGCISKADKARYYIRESQKQ